MIKDYSVENSRDVPINILKEIFPDLKAVRRMPTRDEINTQYDLVHHIASLNRDNYVRCDGMYVVPNGPFDTNGVKEDVLVPIRQKGTPIAASINMYEELDDLAALDPPLEEDSLYNANRPKVGGSTGIITKVEARARAVNAGPLRSKAGKNNEKVNRTELKRVTDKNKRLNEEYEAKAAQSKEGKVVIDMEKRNKWREARRHINPYTGCLTEFYYPPGKEPVYTEGLEDKPSDGSPSGPDRFSYVEEHSVTDPDDPPYTYDSQDDVHERADETEDTDSSYEPHAKSKVGKIRTRDVTIKNKKLKDAATKQGPNSTDDQLVQVSSNNEEIIDNLKQKGAEEEVIPPLSELQFTMKPVAKASKLSGIYRTVWDMGTESRRYDYYYNRMLPGEKRNQDTSIHTKHSRQVDYLMSKGTLSYLRKEVLTNLTQLCTYLEKDTHEFQIVKSITDTAKDDKDVV